VVRAMILIRANVLAKGFSGIRPLVAERLCDLLNRGVTPVVPSQGSVGASGDLAPLAHMALVLMGEGEAEYEGAVMPGGEALARAGIEAIELHPKEGISLINGTQAMLAIGCLELAAAEILAGTAEVLAAMTLDAQRGTPRAFDERIHAARPHPGQLESAAHLRRLMEGSEIRESHRGCGRVQDAYSLRCIPQVHGPVREALAEARRVFAIELNSATDNPLVFHDEILSGGNFHGESLALLAHPASTGSITTSGNKEDFVSMGMTSAVKLQRVVRNTRAVLAIEALTAARALDLLTPLKSSPVLEEARERIRAVSPPLTGDRPYYKDIEQIQGLIASGGLSGL
jgi:histidine ammonia-lyase